MTPHRSGEATGALPGAGVAPVAVDDPPAAQVAVVLLNWNGWRDTVACLESLYASRGSDFRVIVCDNASSDDSPAHLLAWAREAEGVAHVAEAHGEPPTVDAELARPRTFLLVHTGANRGFAGGNNVGIAAALADPAVEYVWLLNNDTTVAPDALSELVAAAQAAGPLVLASARVRDMARPERVWFEGGVYSPWSATARHVAARRFATAAHAYLSGCALLISRAAIERIGMLDESMFMYGEDVEYSARARRAGVPLIVAMRAEVLHAGGASSGVGSAFSYRHHVANMVRAVKGHHGRWRLLTIVPYHVAKALFLFAARHRSRALLGAYMMGLAAGCRADKQPTAR